MVLLSVTKLDLWPKDILGHMVLIMLETFSLVAKIASVWILIFFAANLGWSLFQFDEECFSSQQLARGGLHRATTGFVA